MIYEDDEYVVSCGYLKYWVIVFGYWVMEKDCFGYFNVEKVRVLGIFFGFIYGKLK